MHLHPHHRRSQGGAVAGLVTALLAVVLVVPPVVASSPGGAPDTAGAPEVTGAPDADVARPASTGTSSEEAVRTRVTLVPTSDAPVDLATWHTHTTEETETHGETGAPAYPDLGPQAPTRGAVVEVEAGVTVLGLRWDGSSPVVPALRVREVGEGWSGWEPMATVVEPGGEGAATEGTLVVGAAQVQVQLAGAAAGDAVLEAWTTSPTAADAEAVAALTGSEGLAVGTRRDWGADEALRGTHPRELVAANPKLGVTVHHTAGSNAYTAEQVPAVLRAIYGYHAQTLGWGDVGYGLLVDRFGRAWEGRAGGVDENIQLAHATGMNRDWQGISVIGDHDAVDVPAEVMSTLASLTAFTLDTHGADVEGEVEYSNRTLGWTRTLPVVHGHEDVMATLCPGFRLYSRLPELRLMVAGLQGDVVATQRVGGTDRYVVAARLAQDAFLEGTRTAYLTSGESLPDALGVGPVAHAGGAAVLLTRRDAVPQASLLALAGLGVQEVVLVGGDAAIAEGVAEDLVARGYAVRRVGGADRFVTAAMLATSVEQAPVAGTAYVASGVEVADALGGAAAAAEVDGSLLLTRPTGVPGATAAALRELGPTRVVVLGGEGAVGPQVLDQLRSVVPGASVERVGGSDRYRTSALVARDAFPTATSTVVASGQAPVDALAGTQLAARYEGPVVLARTTCLPAAVSSVYADLGVTLSRLAGGSDVLSWDAGSRTC